MLHTKFVDPRRKTFYPDQVLGLIRYFQVEICIKKKNSFSNLHQKNIQISYIQ